jgi:hypothetical protein
VRFSRSTSLAPGHFPWARLLAKVYEIDPLGGGSLRSELREPSAVAVVRPAAQAQYIFPGASWVITSFSIATALARPSSMDIRASSCSMEITES